MVDQARIAQRVEQWLLRDLKQTADELLECTAAAAQRLGNKQGSMKSNQKELLESSFDGLVQQVVKLRCVQRQQFKGCLPRLHESQPGLGPAYTSIVATEQWIAKGRQLEQDQHAQDVQDERLEGDAVPGQDPSARHQPQPALCNPLIPARSSSELLPAQHSNMLETLDEQQQFPTYPQRSLQCFDQPNIEVMHTLPNEPDQDIMLPAFPVQMSDRICAQQSELFFHMPNIMRPDTATMEFAHGQPTGFSSQGFPRTEMNHPMMMDMPHAMFEMAPAQVPNNMGMQFDMNIGHMHTGMPQMGLMPMFMQHNDTSAPLHNAMPGFQQYDLPHPPLGSHWHPHM